MDKKEFKGSEQRKFPRLDANFILSYRIKQIQSNYDITQTKNLSQGGAMLTTNRKYEQGTYLVLMIKMPFISQKIEITGEVVACKEIARNLIYETRLKYTEADEKFIKELGEFIAKKIPNDY